ncbi:uncharacterized protein LOC120650549 isoform X1 [Panicum virgatum]|uniref:uncharacterized protein LOC120650549 isoform X1 n=1 Tax=Panicum virgatum TaxID=38727 RepID=UPI0019D56966|nr:uncharacterized protein LOC120650549 isoform X1 [Panicum virgatum]
MLNAEQQKLCVFTITLAESRAGGAAAGGFASFLPRRARRNRMRDSPAGSSAPLRDMLDAEQFSTAVESEAMDSHGSKWQVRPRGDVSSKARPRAGCARAHHRGAAQKKWRSPPPFLHSAACRPRRRSRGLRPRPPACARALRASPVSASPSSPRRRRPRPRSLLRLPPRTRSGGSTSCCARFRKRGADSQRGPTSAPPSRRPSYVAVEELAAGEGAPLDLAALDGTWRLCYTSASDVLVLFEAAERLPLLQVGQIYQKFECKDQSDGGIVRNVVRWSIENLLEDQEGATLMVSAKFVVLSKRNIFLQFEEVAVENIKISEQLQALIAPAILPRSFLSLQILQFLKTFRAQVPVSGPERRSRFPSKCMKKRIQKSLLRNVARVLCHLQGLGPHYPSTQPRTSPSYRSVESCAQIVSGEMIDANVKNFPALVSRDPAFSENPVPASSYFCEEL